MARGKKSGPGGGAFGAGFLVLLGLIVLVPKQVWIGIAVIAIVGVALYFYLKHSKTADMPSDTVDAQSGRGNQNLSSSGPRSVRAGFQPQSRSLYQAQLEDVPVTVVPAHAQSSGRRVPNSPQGFGEGKWISAGQSVEVAGLTLPGGLLYIGTVLKTPSGANDPALIDPSKPVAPTGDFTERQTNYWPSYSEISPAARRAYLEWLSQGRRHPEADVGYVFLYFYGLERRALIDASKDAGAQADWPAIAQEVRELLSVYGNKSSSFRRYAGELLNWVVFGTPPANLYQRPVPRFFRTGELPLYVKLALGQAALDTAPVPAHLALAWAQLDPNFYLRTPATRCPEQFKQLFELKYSQEFGAGMVLPLNKTKLKFVYRPASAGFRGYGEIKLTFGMTPDVTVLTAPSRKLQPVIESSTKELEAYSRFVGRNPGQGASLDALLQLPATLWPASAQKVLQELKARLEKGMVVFTFRELLSLLEAKAAPTKEKVMGLATALESLNVSMEPDVLGGAKAPKPEETVVLFTTPPGDAGGRSTPSYQAALLTLQLSSAVAHADGNFGVEEIRHLRIHIQSWNHLSPGQRQRLLAQLRLLIAVPVSLASLKKRLEPLDASAKEGIAAFMATVAQSDGTVTPAEVKMLEKVYKALGVEPKKVFGDVHAAATGGSTPSPVWKVAATGFKLDPARIAALQQDTEKVSAILANIFKEEPSPQAVVVPEPDEDELHIVAAPIGLLGLDEAHSALARILLTRAQWSRAELLDVATDLDLMLDGALEQINEASFDAHDMSFTEGDDPIAVSAEVLEKAEA